MLRKLLLDIEPTERHIDGIDSGFYSPESTEQTYRELLDQARPWLERGKPVVLDASYLRAEHRQAALRLAEETSVLFLALECQADESLVRERLAERQGAEQVVSDGRWEVYQAQMERLQPPDELPASARVIVDSAQPLRTQIDSIVTRLTS